MRQFRTDWDCFPFRGKPVGLSSLKWTSSGDTGALRSGSLRDLSEDITNLSYLAALAVPRIRKKIIQKSFIF